MKGKKDNDKIKNRSKRRAPVNELNMLQVCEKWVWNLQKDNLMSCLIINSTSFLSQAT